MRNSRISSITPKVLIELQQVVKTYETPSGPFTALRNIDLQVNAGEFAAVIGKSGSGKSTLINVITGIDRPTLGKVVIGKTAIHALSEDEMAVWRGKNLGVVFQFFQLLPTLTVVENIMLPMELSHLYPGAQRAERAMHLLELVGLAEQAYKFPSAISGGQQQRAAIARALANDPTVLIADEPTGSLDSKTGDAIFQLFEDFVAQGRTVLMVTHDRSLASRVSRVIYIADGEITDQYIQQALPALSSAEQVQVLSNLEPVSYAPGAVIFKQGEVADRFYIIVKGEVEVVFQHKEGGEVILNRLLSGQYFGEIGLLTGGTRNATVRAAPTSNVVVMQLDREHFLKLTQSSQLTRDELARQMSQRVRQQQILSALPSLEESQGYIHTDEYEVFNYQPGAIIIREGDSAEYFYIITQGEVEVLRQHPGEPETVVATLGIGQFFGEMGLLHGGKRFNTVQAAAIGGSVQVIALNRRAFQKLVNESNLTKDEIAQVMQQRLANMPLS